MVNGTMQRKVVRGKKGGRVTPRKSIPDIGREVHGFQSLRTLKTQRDRIDLDIRRHVVAARKGGVTWAELGAALGVTQQAVQRKYAKFLPQRELKSRATP